MKLAHERKIGYDKTMIVLSPPNTDVWQVAKFIESDAQRSCIVLSEKNIAYLSSYDWYCIRDRINSRETILVIQHGLVTKDLSGKWTRVPFVSKYWSKKDIPLAKDRLTELADEIQRLNPMKLPYATPDFPRISVYSGNCKK